MSSSNLPSPTPPAGPPPPRPPPPRPPPGIATEQPAARTAAFGSAANTHVSSSDTTDFQASRQDHIGTRLAGTEGLSEPGAEQRRLRLAVGKVVPGTRYRILRWLGEGGMGVVYEAEHIDIDRHVALKILRFDLSQQPNMAQVFRDEARAASRIGSPNIVEIYDFGELPDGRLFFCMEMLDGHDLIPASEDEWTRPEQLIPMLRQICKGLHAAHRSGIIHRDIKPENIIVLAKDGRQGTIKLVDFGISAMLSAGTHTGGSVAGTPHYMAPEQITGQAFDGRLDIYALGCLAYELLVGHPPFLSDNVEQLLRLQLSGKPKAPRKSRPDREIPPALEAVVMRCLQKAPEQRYRDMADLEAALCEAQIDARLTTAWDDLALPEVEEGRRERLLREMPSPLADLSLQKRRWLWPTVAGISSVVAAVGLYVAVQAQHGRRPGDTQVDALTNEAHKAAARNSHIFPSSIDEGTAYQAVLALEQLASSAGETRGSELRGHYAGVLTAVGNRWWEIPDSPETRKIAREYYWQALVFDDENALALKRSGFTPGMFLAFRENARTGHFSATQLAMGKVLNALAEADEAKRETYVSDLPPELMRETVVFGRANPVAVARRVGLVRGQLPTTVPPPMPASLATTDSNAAVAISDSQTAAPSGPAVEFGREATPSSRITNRKKRRKRRGDPTIERAGRDPARASELARQGNSALNQGKRRPAETLFHRAIGYDRRNAAALMGLSDIYFDTGSKQKAVLYAERAVATASANKHYRLKLGDAYYRVLRYRDALTQYTKAATLGLPRAQQRIAKVKAKIGE
ncbi:MAG: protein kinase [Nannocystaceae bacterium]